MAQYFQPIFILGVTLLSTSSSWAFLAGPNRISSHRWQIKNSDQSLYTKYNSLPQQQLRKWDPLQAVISPEGDGNFDDFGAGRDQKVQIKASTGPLEIGGFGMPGYFDVSSIYTEVDEKFVQHDDSVAEQGNHAREIEMEDFTLESVDFVWVLLFNPGSESEGIHSLEYDGQNIVLGFESENEAGNYALMLGNQNFYRPVVERISSTDIEQFCEQSGVILQLVPEGSDLLPPEKNKENVDFDPYEGKHFEAREGTEAEFAEGPTKEAIRNNFEDMMRKNNWNMPSY